MIKIINHDYAVGLGSSLMRILHCLYYKKQEDLLYFNFYNKDYSDKNLFDVFFVQPFKKEIGTNPVKVEYINDIWKLGDFFLCYGNEQNTKFGKDQFEKKERVDTLRNLWTRYIKIRESIIAPANLFWSDYFNNKQILGVHKRGTDQFGPNGHARGQRHLLDDNYYIKVIDEMLNKQKFDNIFLSTDEQQTVNVLKKRYGSMLIKQDTFLCPPNSIEGIHNIHKNSSEANRNQIAQEVLKDIFLLSKCNFCLNVKSNVSLASIFMRTDYNYKFIDNHIDYGALG